MSRDSDSEATADSREQGVEFGDLEDELSNQEYPMTQADLLAELGDHEIETAGGSTTLREVLGEQRETSADGDERTYESASAVHQDILNMVGGEAVGRSDYSDRGGETPDADSQEEEETDEESL